MRHPIDRGFGTITMAPHRVRFANNYATLPASHPHIIDDFTHTSPNGDERTNMKLPDALATLLYKMSSPTEDLLARFLDPTKRSFTLMQAHKSPNRPEKLFITRGHSKILVR
jgi:hypothetical protein